LTKEHPKFKKHSESLTRYFESRDRQWSGVTPFKLVDPDGKIIEGNSINWLIDNFSVSQKIYKLINKKVKAYKGWYRFGEKPDVIKVKNQDRIKGGKPKPVFQYDLDGNMIKEWCSIAAISKELNLSAGTLSTFIIECRPFKGFIWKRNDVIETFHPRTRSRGKKD
jgi:hypothetical protein